MNLEVSVCLAFLCVKTLVFTVPSVLQCFTLVIVIVIFLGQFCPRGKGAMSETLHVCVAPTHETKPDHNTGNYVPCSFQ